MKDKFTHNHFCIFEISQPHNHTLLSSCKFVMDFDDYSEAEDMRVSLNNFRKSPDEVHFVLRCLNSYEFEHVHVYNPWLKTILFCYD